MKPNKNQNERYLYLNPHFNYLYITFYPLRLEMMEREDEKGNIYFDVALGPFSTKSELNEILKANNYKTDLISI